MSSDAPFAAIKNYLDANWPTTPLLYENDGREPPDPSAQAAWVYVEVTSTLLSQIEIGSPDTNAWRESGILFLHVFVQAGAGTASARTHAKALANLFRGQVLSSVVFHDASIGLGRPGDENGLWWGLPVSIEWTYDDH